MATAVDICNLSLSLLGDPATVTSINPADGSPQAGHCARWYPLALRKVLESHDWSFATKRVKPPLLANFDLDAYEWKYAYAVPSDCVRITRVSHEARGWQEDFEVELNAANNSRVLLTNVEDCVLTYVSYVSEASVLPIYFVQALTLLLASYLVGPLKRADTTSQSAQGLMQMYAAALSEAMTSDAKTGVHQTAKRRIPGMIRARFV